ncbi:E3 ubiquitin-protein ligase SIRP1 [Lactuca sativa]|uniref:RING-type E3 ubiquitin transferase n=1 Tax=Lactuca sativa TaxID=4236 RepID=A0A9R1WF60_LACSA|nr:E3 ubiquitin-protein ligase SIRP1 [Lactuca sativa]XP_023748651.1 E3 ubiquitin-protein ligase SIRP1 [Lactuca sativa]KAJ0225592.1 hypothetical protein LSAT_V11C100027660 [Lactuca sativa]
MDEDRESTRYWCHQCNRPVVPIIEVLTIKCSSCHGEFMEEMDSVTSDHHHHHREDVPDRGQSLWAPVFLGMMNNPRRRRRFSHIDFDEDNEEEDRHRSYNFREGGDSDLDREFESIMRRRGRSSAAILHLLQGVRSGSENNTSQERDHDRERVILINPFNQTIVVQGSGGGTHPIGSLGDYFSGPGLDELLQHLSEIDPNRHGTRPAQKQAVEAMPTVKIDENSVQCSVCLDDFEVGNEAKEMPCKHKFHSKCILPWLELHSSCPVCRFELPSDETRPGQETNGSGGSEDGDDRNLRRLSLPWPFSTLFGPTTGPQPGSMPSASSSGSSPWARRAYGEDEEQ